MDIDSLWVFSDPALSEERFRDALDVAERDVWLELQTQIARSYSLRRNFEKTDAILSEIEPQLEDAGARPKIRYLLERGRYYHSSGQRDESRPYFTEAWELGLQHKVDGLAVDAAHMMAITYSSTPDGITWNQKALDLANESTDKKALGMKSAIFNNLAWDHFDLGKYQQALNYFYEAERAWETSGQVKNIHIAKWSVARCLRALERNGEALTILEKLEENLSVSKAPSGFLYEELAENYLVLNNEAKAISYFQKAYQELSQNDWFVKNEATRLNRLRNLSAKNT